MLKAAEGEAKGIMCTRLRIWTFIFALLFCAGSMWGMLLFAEHKAIIIGDAALEQAGKEAFQTEGGKELPLRFRQNGEEASALCIPLEAGIRAENITIENHYMERQFWIYIEGTSSAYYAREAISGNITGIEEGNYEYAGDTVLLKFGLNSVYECKSVLEEGKLYIEFVPPREVYDKIIVIDADMQEPEADSFVPLAEGMEAKPDGREITDDIVKRLRLLLDGSGIKVYYTGSGTDEVSAAGRAVFANTIGADMCISIRLNEGEDEALYGIEALYNAEYFIPDFGNVELADSLVRHVTASVSGRGNGLFSAEETEVLLKEAKVPAAVVLVGYISNRQERLLLQREDYRDRIADGLYRAILAAYEG